MAFGRDRDLYKTKLCTLYIQRGQCPRQTCSFAHGRAELRRVPGRIETHNGNRFDRHSSMNRLRRSHSREKRGLCRSPLQDRDQSHSPAKRRRSRSTSAPESSECRRRNSKNIRSDANDTHPSDVSAENIGTDSAAADKDEKPQSRNNLFRLRDALEEQLGELREENSGLLAQKSKLELVLESKLQETTELSDKVTMLDEKLAGAQEDCKGLTSRTKKLVKVYKGYTRAQEDLKKAQAKLMKLVDDVVVDSYNKVAVDLDSMRAMLPAHTGDLGNHETTHAGTFAKKEVNCDNIGGVLAEGISFAGSNQTNSNLMQEKKTSLQTGLQQIDLTNMDSDNLADP